MKIEKRDNHLVVYANIYFDEKDCFCGKPYLSLIAHGEPPNCGSWKPYTICIGIRDDDDFDVGLIYKTDEMNFKNILHELINWMRDHEQGISTYMNIWEPLKFFPDLGCERRRW